MRYLYRLDGGEERPDPASRCQPDGVHGRSLVVDRRFAWSDRDWKGIPLGQYIFYELHVGAFTPEGTFDAVIPHLDRLVDLGITAVELMPVAQFPGERNWGYDGVFPYAVQNSYGGPEGLKRLVDAAHARGLAVVLDVVYNHLGPEGNYLRCFSASYFTSRRMTPWGEGIDVDGPGAAGVRELLVGSAAMWIERYHLDGLRLDATHAIEDRSAVHVLRELGERVRHVGSGKRPLLIAEDERNEAALMLPAAA